VPRISLLVCASLYGLSGGPVYYVPNDGALYLHPRSCVGRCCRSVMGRSLFTRDFFLRGDVCAVVATHRTVERIILVAETLRSSRDVNNGDTKRRLRTDLNTTQQQRKRLEREDLSKREVSASEGDRLPAVHIIWCMRRKRIGSRASQCCHLSL
jgi:siderophore synthetase component